MKIPKVHMQRMIGGISFMMEWSSLKTSTGTRRLTESVIAARRLEIEYFKKMGVYEKVDRSEVTKMKGKVITTKWLDTNKGDLDTPNYRSRVVAREINIKKRLDLFSATPPLEAFKILIAKCALGGKKSRLAGIDIKRAYFYAPATRPIFVEIPEEDRVEGDECKVGRLMLSLYGTRDAAQNWCITYTQFLLELGFTRGTASPCNFRHNALELDLTVHGDDFLVVGGKKSISWLTSRMTNKFEAKVNVIGPDADEEKEVRILNRIIRWTSTGLTYEADQRHAELVVKELGLDNAKAIGTLHVSNTDEGAPGLLDSATSRHYRSIVARVNFLAQDRCDI